MSTAKTLLAPVPRGTVEEACFEGIVVSKTPAADGVVLLTLRHPNGEDLPQWLPGAHVDLVLPNGLTRQYSLCGDPADRSSYSVAVLKAPSSRGGSRYVHESLAAGDPVTVRGPRNHFRLVDAPGYLFIAGGIGITPIAAMIRDLQRQGKPWRLVYGGRTLSSMAFRDELAGTRATLWPQDQKGIIDLHAVLGSPDRHTAVYACGPEPLLAAVESICAEIWPTGALHLERFTAKVPDATENAGFEIELAASGVRLPVPADKSVLRVLEEAGIRILSSCGEGTCGTCETVVTGGTIDHRDSVLTEAEKAENNAMMVCVSRATCPVLTLDL